MGKHVQNVARDLIHKLRITPADLGLANENPDPSGSDSPSELLFNKYGDSIHSYLKRLRPETLGRVIACARDYTTVTVAEGKTSIWRVIGPKDRRFYHSGDGMSILRRLAALTIVAEMTDVLGREWNRVEVSIVEHEHKFLVRAYHPDFGERWRDALGMWTRNLTAAEWFATRKLARENSPLVTDLKEFRRLLTAA